MNLLGSFLTLVPNRLGKKQKQLFTEKQTYKETKQTNKQTKINQKGTQCLRRKVLLLVMLQSFHLSKLVCSNHHLDLGQTHLKI